MIQLLIKTTTIWFAVDVLLLATIWYLQSTLRVAFPNWWKANICDYAPEYFFDL